MRSFSLILTMVWMSEQRWSRWRRNQLEAFFVVAEVHCWARSAPPLPSPRPNATTCLWVPGLCGGPDAPGDHRGSPGKNSSSENSYLWIKINDLGVLRGSAELLYISPTTANIPRNSGRWQSTTQPLFVPVMGRSAARRHALRCCAASSWGRQ